jgi:hypothetical protein
MNNLSPHDGGLEVRNGTLRLSITHKCVRGRFLSKNPPHEWHLALSPPSTGCRSATPLPARGRGKTFFAGFERLCRSKPALIRSPFPLLQRPVEGLLRGKGPEDRGLLGANPPQKMWVIDSPLRAGGGVIATRKHRLVQGKPSAIF